MAPSISCHRGSTWRLRRIMGRAHNESHAAVICGKNGKRRRRNFRHRHGRRKLGCRAERADRVMARILICGLLLCGFSIRAQMDQKRPRHGANHKRRTRGFSRHPAGRQQRAQHHRCECKVHCCQAKVADHGVKVGPGNPKIKRQCVAFASVSTAQRPHSAG